MDLENVNGGSSDGGGCNKGQSGDGNDDNNSSDPSDIDHDSIVTYEVKLSSSIVFTVSHNFFHGHTIKKCKGDKINRKYWM